MADIQKYTKKANAYIMKQLLKMNPKASKLTSFDGAYVYMMTEWDLDGDLELSKGIASFKIWRDDEVVETLTWSKEKAWVDKEMDFDWNLIYKDVLEKIIKDKLYKRPKLSKRALKKKEEAKQEAIIKANKEKEAQELAKKKEEELVSMRKKKGNLQQRIYDWKKKGKDASELIKEYDEVCDYLKTNDPTIKPTKPQKKDPAPKPIKKVEKKPEIVEDRETLTRLKGNLQQRIYDWKKKGKDATELIQEYNRISKKLKEMK